VNSSLLETAIAGMSVGVANFNADGEPGARHGSGVAFIVPHRAYAAEDGHLIVSCANDPLFAKLCAALDHPEWATDERFATNAGRLKNRAEIDRLIGERMSQETRAFWTARLQAAGLPVAPIQTTGEMLSNEQTQALGIIEKPSDDEIGIVGLPISFDGKRPPPLHSARDTGADNALLERELETNRRP
jgi:crotonobetainyl-CoA:carnitine CoA-transferase CaiB-like acyl-CoA transferase